MNEETPECLVKFQQILKDKWKQCKGRPKKFKVYWKQQLARLQDRIVDHYHPQEVAERQRIHYLDPKLSIPNKSRSLKSPTLPTNHPRDTLSQSPANIRASIKPSKQAVRQRIQALKSWTKVRSNKSQVRQAKFHQQSYEIIRNFQRYLERANQKINKKSPRLISH